MKITFSYCFLGTLFVSSDAFTPVGTHSLPSLAYASNGFKKHNFIQGKREVSSRTIHSMSAVATIPQNYTEGVMTNMEDIPITKETTERNDDVPKLGTIMKMLPADIFNIDTKTSLFYFGVDTIAVLGCLGLLKAVVSSSVYLSMPIWAKALTVAPLQVMAGFAGWCMWCIGHDAGHGTISKKNWINRVVGEISHSVFSLTPFVPWKKSHQRHHLHHNHITRDYSYQWVVRETANEKKLVVRTRLLTIPILYLAYLLIGFPDGGHVFFYGRLWKNEPLKEKVNASVSSVVSLATALSLWFKMGTADFAVVCFAPWLVLSFWLFMVTYLQHHSEDGVIYTDDTWSFTKGAFETVDRDYGKWINRMSHHMMDGHVVHHLFFTKVPHYRLKEATISLRKGLEKAGKSHLYKQIDTPNFTQVLVKTFHKNWFYINEAQVARKKK